MREEKGLIVKQGCEKSSKLEKEGGKVMMINSEEKREERKIVITLKGKGIY